MTKKNLSWIDLDKVSNDLDEMASKFISELSFQAEKDMIQAHNDIIDQYYSSKPTNSSYHRKNSGNLYWSLNRHFIKNSNHKNSKYAKVLINANDMQDHTRVGYDGVNQENVFDLVWNEGIRGLPYLGSSPLSHSYCFYNHHFEFGDKWKNPFWSGEESPYNNIFMPSISLNGYKTQKGTSSDVFEEIVSNWDEVRGKKLADKIADSISKNF